MLCRASRVRARPTEENKLQVEPGPAEMVRQRPVVVSGCFEPDPKQAGRSSRGAAHSRSKSSSVFMTVKRRRRVLPGDADQHFMAMLGNVDGDQQGRRR